MSLISLRQLLDHAAEHDYGVPAFNINNMEQLLAIMQAARRCSAPVILQASRGARSYAGDLMLQRMVEAAAANGWIDGPAVALEQLTALKRAGASFVLTYFAGDLAEMLGG